MLILERLGKHRRTGKSGYPGVKLPRSIETPFACVVWRRARDNPHEEEQNYRDADELEEYGAPVSDELKLYYN